MKTPLKGLLFLAALLMAIGTAHSASITVDSINCLLADAITAANTDTAAGNCLAGSGADTIILQTDVTLTAALPEIASTITIEGGGHKIDGNNDANVGTVLRVANSGNLILNETIITRGYNTSGCGGGIYTYGGGIITLNSSVVIENSVTSFSSSFDTPYSDGGGICSYDGTIILNNSIVSGNSVSSSSSSSLPYSQGGGIYSYDGTIMLNNSTVSGNSAYSDTYSWGGGIYSYEGTVTLNNSTVSGNSTFAPSSTISFSEGGGIFSFRGTITLISSTVSGNSAFSSSSPSSFSSSYGGGIRSGGTTILRSSIVSGNTASFGGNEFSGTVTADGHNIFGHSGETSAQAFVSFTSGSSDVTATSDGTKPTALSSILSPLSNNSGPTQTHALPVGSPAIDLDATCSTGLSTDQRGYPRPFGNGCDAGAFEFGAVANQVNMAPIYKLLLFKRR